MNERFGAMSPLKSSDGKARRTRRGHTLVEVLVTSVITLLILTGVVALLRTIARSVDRQGVAAQTGNRARTSLDEVASVMRYANAVETSKVINGTTYVTGKNTVVLSAQGYDPATPGLVLPGVTDLIALTFDSTNKRVLESIQPGTGSARPSRTAFPIARDVQSADFSYTVRESPTPTVDGSGNVTYTLKTAPTTPPVMSVNGKATQNTWTKTFPKVVAVNANPKSNIEVVYEVDPAANPGESLQYVKEVTASVVLNSTDSYNVNRTQSMTSTARLRNQRK